MRHSILCGLCTLNYLLFAGSLFAQPLKTDRGVYPEPALPALPSAGGIIVDPTFGTQIMRISDESDGSFNRTAYSNWPTFNVDNTRLHFHGDVPTLYDFDPETFTLGAKSQLWESANVDWEDAIWSGSDPDVIYRREGYKLYSHNVVTETSTLLKDFTDLLPEELSVHRLGHMSMSLDDNRFAFTFKPSQYANQDDGYLAWDRATEELLVSKVESNHAVHLDKTGQYLLVKTGLGGAGQTAARVVDLDTSATVDLTPDGPDYAPGHYDLGHGTILGIDGWRNGVTLRNAATPEQNELIHEFPSWKGGKHVSLLADNESWAVVSSYTGSEVEDEFDSEIYLVATDGSERVRRVAHHRSVFHSYWDSPRANITRYGRFIAFTSNWGDSGRRDVFVAAVPVCLIGDANCDGRVSILDDIQTAFANFTGPGSFGKTRIEGDVHSLLTGATDHDAGHDGDVDVLDLLTMFGAFSAGSPDEQSAIGLAAAGDPGIPDLIYDPATGEVILDPDGSSIIGYSLQSASSSFQFAGHTPILGGVSTSLANELSEAALSSPAISESIGFVFPPGLDLAGLSTLLSTNQVSRALGSPLVPFDLVVLGPAVPEPSSFYLALVTLSLSMLARGVIRRPRARHRATARPKRSPTPV